MDGWAFQVEELSMVILITGGSGFIGLRLSEALLQK
jgi:NAD(P)-dependent dehydrogenase (short-subunit alcohol dehydrogenase family)